MIYDYIVVGSGFGGSVASLRLAEKASFMLGRIKYSKLNMEDKILEEVSKEMNNISRQLLILEEEWKKKILV